MSTDQTASPGDGAAGALPAFPGTAPPPPTAAGPPAFPTQVPTPGGYPPPPPQGDATQYASWGIRLGGYLIDFVIFAVVLLVLILVFRGTHALEVHLAARRGSRHRSFSAVPFLITAVLYIAYGTILCGSPRGQTVGMTAVGVRAVRAETLEILGYGRALARAVVEGFFRLLSLLSPILGIVWIIDMVFPLWDARRQTLHDKVAASVVLRTRAAPG